ncbi:hypothetical protein [Cellulomonas citrea]|uniref:hypothetical protein n=1 Tax=Cellulomonas citrea TaxID=1909423 RepID=UPI00135AB2BC|nr:hypothetical protein [Cellulomonas citrea]
MFSLSGCVFAPSDPKTVPIAVRMDGDVVSVLVPQCPGGSVESAYVDDLGAEEPGVKLWQASGFVGKSDEPISFSSSSWSSVSGSYENLESFGVMVVTEKGEYGGGLDSDYLSQARGLPPGRYVVDGQAVTSAEYFAEAAKYPCPAPGSSTAQS